MKMGERLIKVETEVQLLKSQNNKDHEEIKLIMREFIDSAESRFASKLTEKIVYGLSSLILVAFITKIINIW